MKEIENTQPDQMLQIASSILKAHAERDWENHAKSNCGPLKFELNRLAGMIDQYVKDYKNGETERWGGIDFMDNIK
tara:strand:+ start:295 stop:522 length:228 start_codon:yes stop_codon:yes gene_type:complete